MGERKLWCNLDVSSEQLTGAEIIKRFRYMNKETKRVAVRGLVEKFPLESWKNNTLTHSTLKSLERAPFLEILSIINGYLNFQNVCENAHI